MDGVIEYVFGAGDGETSAWRSVADLDLNADGVFDAVSLDFDGDGLADDAMVDTDADGVADLSALDLDDDGLPETFFADGGSGLWERAADRPSGPPLSPAPTAPGESVLDTDADGTDDTVLIDTDGDGYADAHRPARG
ncbi:hypothetical protein L5I01_10135 [Gordonia sp. HY442]|uniref:hypothetical protein n=1 Tax=Gordonia zhenghanii TaxID=2911516 RepID=UPI001F1D5685|nr:hypothetical protein [Gordonia zhenghanii]MCF8603714.1 hypothetical protein [Gordonia zhenghanii]